ncbi:MAG: succinylglutamate desuccinylase/aspartoacylase family protein [Candidatus Nanohaloarchaea archaeon]|nr:succinylglutamate desuccinylase/aspartoacylase family protein [Candidatus Nanohaloarchaea archaeon]
MQVIDRGPGEPEVAVVALVHGDEPCGRKAIERLLDETESFRQPVRFIYANEKAAAQNERFIDEDLNRVFPAPHDPETHEQRLAQELETALDGMDVLDLHSTVSHDEAYLLYTRNLDGIAPLLQATGIGRAVDISHVAGGLIDAIRGVAVECGPKGTEKAEEQAYSAARTFLVNQGVINGERAQSNPEIYQITDEVTKEEDWRFTATNFKQVGAGEQFATSDNGQITAEEAFYPILMSTDGYDDILGFKARRLGRLFGLSTQDF